MKLNSFTTACMQWLLPTFSKIFAPIKRCIPYWDKRKLIMRLNLSVVFLIFFMVQASAASYGQKISIIENNISLEKVLQAITEQSDYEFVYNTSKLKKIQVSVNFKNAPIEQVLNDCFKNLPFAYKIVKNNILVKEVESSNVAQELKAPVQQKKRVNGLVLDTTRAPLPGVSIYVKNNKSVGTTTDMNGRYVLEVSETDVIVFSMVGFNIREIPVKDKAVIDVVLHEVSNELEDVVVVAFGTQKKLDLVGSVTSISPKDLKVPSSNLTTALAGRIAGVIAYQRSGEPGQDNADFFIRGVTTFGYKKDPLILIDGVEFTSTDLARLQPDDIGSFSIMKDASATALYGARGANGVILVTTKEGKEGKAKVSFRMENSISMPTQNVELADPITYMKLHNEAVKTRDPLGLQPYSQHKIDNTIAGGNPYLYPAVDWRKEMFKEQTMNQRGNLNVSGGGQVARYYFAGTFNKDNGILKTDQANNFKNNIDLKSYTIRSNVNVNLTKTTEVGVRMYGSFDEYTGPLDGGAQMYSKVMRSNPVMFPAFFPITEKYSDVQHIMFGGTDKGSYINPYADMVKGYRDYSRSLLMAQFELKQKLDFITKGLSFRAMGNTNRTSYFSVSRFYKPFYYQASDFDAASNELTLQLLNEREGAEYLDYKEGEKTIKSTFYMESALNFTRTYQEKHGISAMLVYQMQQSLNANAGDLQQSLPFRNLGLSGRFTYSYDSRYFGEFNFGYNGSERFHQNQRFGFFPSGGVAWQVSGEKFWENIKPVISLLKLRATYGLVGNDAIGGPEDRFFYLSNVDMNDGGRGATFGTDFNYTNSGVSISRYDNAAITWEIAKKANIGIEMKLFDKIGLQADFFSESRKNILMTRAFIPSYMGLSANVRANVGEASGKGMDLSIDYQHNITPDFWVTTRGNFTLATSAFDVYEEPEYENEPWKSRVGYPLSQQMGYIAERLFVDDQEVANSPLQDFGMLTRGGDIKYRDVNGDGQITALDQVAIGNPTTPEIVYGFGFSTGFKNFDLSCFFQGVGQESFWIDPVATAPFIGERQLLKVYADSHWSEENNDVMALWPRLSAIEHPNNTQRSTWFMRNGSFLRLKTAEFGYTIPKKRLKRVGLESIRIWGSNDPDLTGGDLGWVKLGEYELIKPSGQPIPTNSPEDLEQAAKGHEFSIPLDAPSVQYVRVRVIRTYGITNYYWLSELSFFGQPIN